MTSFIFSKGLNVDFNMPRNCKMEMLYPGCKIGRQDILLLPFGHPLHYLV